MCTIVAIKGRNPQFPMIVAANRDEFYARAASRPEIVHEQPRALAGRDLVRGGSWMGANEHGVFFAITNQRTYAMADRNRASRGAIVIEALAQRDVHGVDELLGRLDPSDYNEFNALYGDAGVLRVAYSRHGEPSTEVSTLDDGIWILPNDRIGSPEFPKTRRTHALVDPIAHRPWSELYEALARVMGDHEKPALETIAAPPPGSPFDRGLLRELQAICIHTAVYGTRSSTLLALEAGRVARYFFADGPPCTTPYEDFSALLSR